MRRAASRLAAVALGLIASWLDGTDGVAAPVEITTTGTYTQNFDTLLGTGTPTWTNDSTIAGWFAERGGGSAVAGAVPTYSTGNGSASGGGVYSFGTTGAADRALGSVGSGTPGNLAYGVLFRNNVAAGESLSLGSLSFTGEQWRNGGNAATQSLTFSYLVSATAFSSLNAADASGGWVTLPALNFTSPITGPTAAALDGNATANRTQLVLDLGSTISLGSGQYVMFRWKDLNDSGSDHALAIDDFSLSWTVNSLASSSQFWTASGTALGGAGTWGTGNTWSSSDTAISGGAYDPAKTAIFKGAGDTVTVAAGGVSANAGLQFSADGYTLSGGGITLGGTANSIVVDAGLAATVNAGLAGASGFVKQGTGTLFLGGDNTAVTGTIGVNAGTLVAGGVAALGADATATVISLFGGTLRTTADVDLGSRQLAFVAGGLAPDAGTTLTYAGVKTFGGLTIAGDGTVALTNGLSGNFGGITFTAPGTLDATVGGVALAGGLTATPASGTATVLGPVYANTAATTITVGAGATLALPGPLDNGFFTVTKAGQGTLFLGGDNMGDGFTTGLAAFSIGSTTANGGTVRVADGAALGRGADTRNQIYLNYGGIEAAAPITAAVGLSIGGREATRSVLSGSAMTFGGPISFFPTGTADNVLQVDNDVTFTGQLTSGATVTGLTVRGAGTLRLQGDGTTFVNRLALADGVTVSAERFGVLGTASLLTTGSGATVTGNGSIGGLTVNAGGRVAPGLGGVGMLTTATTIFAAGGNYNVQVSDATGGEGSGWDTLNVIGTLSIAASSTDTFTINLASLAGATSGSAANFSAATAYTWRVATASGGVTGFAGDKFTINTAAGNGSDGFANDLAGGSFKATTTGNDLNVVFTPFVPGTALTWFGDGTTAGGSGEWTPLGSTWSPDGTTVGTWDPARTAVFNATSGTVTVAAGGITANRGLQFDSPGYRVAGGSITLGGTSADANAIAVVAAGTATVDSSLQGSGGLAKTGFGTLVITGSGGFTGGTQVREGTLQVGAGGATGSLPGAVAIDAGATLAFDTSSNGTVSGALSGAGVVVQQGVGDLRLAGANGGHSGGVRVAAGSVTAAAGGALGTGTTTVTAGSLYVESGVTNAAPIVVQATASVAPFTALTWNFGTGTTPLAQPSSGVPSGLTVGDLTRVNSGTSGDPLLAAGSTSSGYAGASGSYNAGLVAGRTPTVVAGTTPAFEFTLTPEAGARVDVTSISFGSRSTSTGPWSYELRSSADGYSAALATWTSTGTAGFADSTWRQLTNDGFAVGIDAGTPVTYRLFGFGNGGQGTISGVNWRIDDLTLGGRMVTGTGAAIAIGTQSTAGTAVFTGRMTLERTVPLTAPAGGTARFEGAIVDGAGANGVEKIGGGTVVLAGDNTYHGATTVAAGTLVVTGSTAASGFTVQSGATLAGTGRVGSLTTTAGATVAPGVGIGTLAAGQTTLAGGAALDWQLYNAGGGSAAGSWDQLAVSGGLVVSASAGSPFTINLLTASNVAGTPGSAVNFDAGVANRWTFATTTSGVTGFDPARFAFTTTGFANDLAGGTFSVVPTTDSLGLDILFTPSVAASSLVWYGDGATAGGTGVWTAGDARWAPTGGGAAGPWQANRTAVFTATPGTVTVDAGGIAANNGLRFEASGYAVEGGGLALGGSALANGIEVVAGGTATIASALTTSTGFTKAGAGELVLTGENSGVAGGATVAAGTLRVGAGGTAGSLAGDVAVAGGGTLAIDRADAVTVAGIVSGAGRLQKDGAGTTTLVGANTYSGGSLVNAGTLVVGDGGTAGAILPTGDVTVSAGATLAVDRSDVTAFSGAVAGAGRLAMIGTGTLVAGRTGTANAYGGEFTLRVANGTVDLNRGGASLAGILGAGNTVELAGGTLQMTASSGGGAVITPAAIDVQADSTIAMNRVGSAANHTTTGIAAPLTLRNGSRLTFDYRGLIGTSTTGVVYAGATTYTGTVSLESNATVEVTNSAGGSGEVTFAGPVVGGFGLTKTGNQVLTLSGSSTYSGPTVVNAGTLKVNGASAASAIAVNGGAALAGAGVVGDVTVNAAGTLLPGDGVGRLKAANAVWNAGGNYNWQIAGVSGSAGSQWDLLAAGGGLTINATTGDPFRINLWTVSATSAGTTTPLAGFNADLNQNWTIGSFAGGISGFSPALFSVVTTAANGTGGFANPLNGTFAVAQVGNDLSLVYTSNAPQPGRYWDANGATPGVGGSGTWDATSQTFAPDMLGTSVTGLASSGTVVFAGVAGTVTVGGTVSPPGGMQFSTTGYTLTGGAIALAAGTSTLTADAGVAATIASDLGQATTTAAVVKAGAGGLRLGGSNSFSGGVAVAAGTLTAASNLALGTGAATVSGSGSLYAASGVTLANAITVSGSASSGALLAGWDFQSPPGTLVTSNTAATPTPTRYVANLGSGTLALDGGNGSSIWTVAPVDSELNGFGGTTVNAAAGFSTATTAPAALALLAGGSSAAGFAADGKSAVFAVDMTGKQALTISYATQRTTTGFTTQDWSYGTDGTNWTALQTISGTAIPASFGTIALNPITALDGVANALVRLTVSGATTSAGNIRLDNVQFSTLAGAAAAEPVSATVTLGSDEAGGTSEFTGPVTLAGNANLRAAAGSTVIFSGSMTGAGGVRTVGEGTVIIAGNATYAGATTVEAGQLRLGVGGTTGAVAGGVQLLAPTAGLVIDRLDDFVFANAVSGSGGLFKEGGNTVTLTGSASHLGGTTIYAGTLVVGNGGTQGALAADGPVDIGAGATLQFNRADDVSLAGGVSGSGRIVQGGLGRLTLSQTSGLGGATLRVESGLVDLNRSGASLVGLLGAGNAVELAGGTLQLSGDAGEETKVVGVPIRVEASSTLAINRTGAAGDHATTGFDAAISVGGSATTLTFDHRGALSSNTLPVVRYRATTTYTGILTLEDAATIAVTNSGGGLSEVVLAGPIVAAGGPRRLTKAGDQTLTLTSTATFTGPTTVAEGVLQLAAAETLASSGVTVDQGATLRVGPQVAATVATLANAGLVDVGSGRLTVAGGLSATDLVAQIIAGRGDGTWSGTTGITSADVAAAGDRAVGWIDNGDGSLSFGFAAAGDLDLNNLVDFDDVLRFVASGLYDTGLAATWAEGDYDYNGVVDFDDVLASVSVGLFDGGEYNPQTRAFRQRLAFEAGGLGGIGSGDVLAANGPVVAVPEPSALAAAAAGLLALLSAPAWRKTRLLWNSRREAAT